MFQIVEIDNQKICVKGVGRLFFQEGLPISLVITALKQNNISVSILHIADECLKNGWNIKTTLNRLKTELEDDIENKYDFNLLEEFCNADYEKQRELIFNNLFKNKEKEVLIDFVNKNFKNG